MTWSLTDGTITVTFSQTTEWDQTQAPILRETATQGRAWSRVRWEGAEALRVHLRAVFIDTPTVQEQRVQQLMEWRKRGTLLTLSSPEPYYNGLQNLRIEDLEAAREIGRLTHRWIGLRLVRTEE